MGDSWVLVLVVGECFYLAGESSFFLYCWSCAITQPCVSDLSLGTTTYGSDVGNGRRTAVRPVENMATSFAVVPLEFYISRCIIFGSTLLIYSAMWGKARGIAGHLP